VSVISQRGAPGTLLVSVVVSRTAAAPNNSISQIRFLAAQNASIEIGGQSHIGGNFVEAMPAGTLQTTFTVRRFTASFASTVPFWVIDDCGAWQTFVGGGPGAF
jgi:hypothetical protein